MRGSQARVVVDSRPATEKDFFANYDPDQQLGLLLSSLFDRN